MTPIGIDLGTTNSLICAWRDGAAQLIPNALGQYLTPSVVSIDDNGSVLVGQAAQERLLTHPERSAAAFKRLMGTDHRFALAEHRFTPEELSALVLQSLKADAEAYLGEELGEVVISVPAYFNDAQRKRTRHAAELAGLKVGRLINEPTAAALAYGMHEAADEDRFLVFDLGGGTFDVSILERMDPLLEVHASAGDNFLGGEDFTRLLVDAFCAEHAIEFDELPLEEGRRLSARAEQVKCQLAQGAQRLHLEHAGAELSLEVDSARFAKLAEPLLARMQQPLEQALRDARLKPSQLDRIILVGGATRMPLIRQLVTRLFGRFPSCEIDPDTLVARGAAVQAALKARDQAVQEVVLTDVCPYSLGTEVSMQLTGGDQRDGLFHPIIERNTVVPVSRMERFTTAHDDQKLIRVGVYQGENRLARDNVLLDQLEIEVPPGPAGSEHLDIRFSFDINGLLEVEVEVASTGASASKLIDNNPAGLTEAQKQASLEKLQGLKIHPREQLENRTLLARSERLYRQLRGEERMHVSKAIADFERELDSQDKRRIRDAREHLNQLLGELEEL